MSELTGSPGNSCRGVRAPISQSGIERTKTNKMNFRGGLLSVMNGGVMYDLLSCCLRVSSSGSRPSAVDPLEKLRAAQQLLCRDNKNQPPPDLQRRSALNISTLSPPTFATVCDESNNVE
jgi:hypothetical protein